MGSFHSRDKALAAKKKFCSHFQKDTQITSKSIILFYIYIHYWTIKNVECKILWDYYLNYKDSKSLVKPIYQCYIKNFDI